MAKGNKQQPTKEAKELAGLLQILKGLMSSKLGNDRIARWVVQLLLDMRETQIYGLSTKEVTSYSIKMKAAVELARNHTTQELENTIEKRKTMTKLTPKEEQIVKLINNIKGTTAEQWLKDYMAQK